MNDDTTEPEGSDIGSLIREARLVFGAVLVDGTPRIIECLDRAAFADGEADVTTSTAIVSVNADLVPFVVDAEAGSEGTAQSTGPGSAGGGDSPRIETFERAESAVSDAGTFYFLANTAEATWKRVRNAPGGFTVDGERTGIETDAYALAAALVAESTERIGDLPEGVTKDDIDIIEWSR